MSTENKDTITDEDIKKWKEWMFGQPILTMPESETFQERVNKWVLICFGEEAARNKNERNHYFLEESLELVQSLGCTADEAHKLVDYVFGRPIGEPKQECGGVMTTLAALCFANNLNMADCGETELQRVWGKIDSLREKYSRKPKNSPLPQ